MNMADLDTFTAEVRALQMLYRDAHQALTNWAAWSRDCAPPCGYGIKPSPVFREYRASDYEDADELANLATLEAPVKAEAAEKEPYDQTAAEVLNDRIHGPGGLSPDQRQVIRVAYYVRGLLERQMPYACGWKQGQEHRFREDLADALAWTARFCA
jgi:hypothetical protein